MVDSTTEGLAIYSRPKAHSFQLEPDSRSLNLPKRNFDNALVSHPPVLNVNMAHEHPPQTQMALVPQPLLSTNSNGSCPSAPSFNSEHLALALQIPLFNFNMGARHNHCHTVDTVMGRPMGVRVRDMQHTMANPKQSLTMGTDIHLPFRDQ